MQREGDRERERGVFAGPRFINEWVGGRKGRRGMMFTGSFDC